MSFSIVCRARACAAPAASAATPGFPRRRWTIACATPIGGDWTYAATAGGSEATFRRRKLAAANHDPLHPRDAPRRPCQTGERSRAVPVDLDQHAEPQCAGQLQSRDRRA